MGLYPDFKPSALELLKKESTIDQDFQNSNNELKFSIASILLNDQLPNKKQINLDQFSRSSNKYGPHHMESNNFPDLSCYSCKPSAKNWIDLRSFQKQYTVRELNALTSLNKLCGGASIMNPQLNHQLNSQISQQLNHQFNQQLNSQLNQQLGQQLIQQFPNRPSSISSSMTNLQISPSSIQSQLQGSNIKFVLQTPPTNALSSSYKLNSKKNDKNSSNQNSVQHISDYQNNSGDSSNCTIIPESIGNKKKRNRTTFSQEQLKRLEKQFKQNQYLVGQDRSILAAELELPEVQVKIWYQNRRIKYRKDKPKVISNH